MPENKFRIPIIQTLLVLLISSSIVVSTKGRSLSPLKCPIPHELKDELHSDLAAIGSASTDYGNMVHFPPSAVLYPSTVQDIQTLIKSSYNCSHPFVISFRGNGHSTQGQDMALNGVVVDMQEYKKNKKGSGISVSKDPLFVDVGSELLWRDVLDGTLKEGVLPVSWTNYLELTVGGTLSNAGIGGQMFRFGPQISNVYEMDVVTGKGELLTCSANENPELFYAVLGGLGQFGVITRARIAVEPAKERVKWLRLLYSNFTLFTKDAESIIAINGRNQTHAVGFLQGQFLLDNGTPNGWITSFFPTEDVPKILSLVKIYGVIYCIEISDPYDNHTKNDVTKKLNHLIKELNPLPGLTYEKDVPYVDFLTRVQVQALKNESHPWLDLFVPKSRIFDFNSGVIRDIVLKRNITFGPVSLYPTNKSKWDHRMSAATPDEEDVFYAVSLLYTSGVANWKAYLDQNDAITKFCDDAGIKYKKYLPDYTEKQQWIKHFGWKWENFEKMKHKFDPKHILSPGQRIFN